MAALRHGKSRRRGLQRRSGARCELWAMKSGKRKRGSCLCSPRGCVEQGRPAGRSASNSGGVDGVVVADRALRRSSGRLGYTERCDIEM